MQIIKTQDFVVTLGSSLVIYDGLTLTALHTIIDDSMSIICSSDDILFIGYRTGIVNALNFMTLKLSLFVDLGSSVTAMCHCNQFLYVGTQNGSIYKYIVKQSSGGMKPQSASKPILDNQNKFNVDTEGLVNKDSLSLVDLDNNSDSSLHTDIRDEDTKLLFKRVKHIRHTAPVDQICIFDTEIYVTDARNKVTIYPSRKCYDVKNPILKFNKYIFASENRILLCKTKEAFSAYLSVDASITDFVFSDLGGICFVQCSQRVYIFRNKVFVSEIRVKNKFIYLNKALIEMTTTGLTKHDLDMDDVNMEDILFRESRIFEKKKLPQANEEEISVSRYLDVGARRKSDVKKHIIGKYIQTECDSGDCKSSSDMTSSDEGNKDSLDLGKKTGNHPNGVGINGPLTNINNAKNKAAKRISDASDSENTAKRSKDSINASRIQEHSAMNSNHHSHEEINEKVPSTRNFYRSRKLETLFSESEDEQIESKCDSVPVVSPKVTFMSGSYASPLANLLCYTHDGYIINTNRLEVKYHDNSVLSQTHSSHRLGHMCGRNLVLADEVKLLFRNATYSWEKAGQFTLINVTNKIVIGVSDLLYVYKLGGTEIFNCLISDINTICSVEEKIAVFSDEILVIDLFKQTERYYLPGVPTFASFDENQKLYYVIGEKLYRLYKGLTVKLLDLCHMPLTVFNDTIVCLKSMDFVPLKLEYKKLYEDVVGALINENKRILSGAYLKGNEDLKEYCELKVMQSAEVPELVDKYTKRYSPFK